MGVLNKMSGVLSGLYTSSAAQVVSSSRRRSRAWLVGLQNRSPRAASLNGEYYKGRDPLIRQLIDAVQEGAELTDVLSGFDGRQFDERIAEYPYVVDWILKSEIEGDLLDVGCVMNNVLVREFVRGHCRNVWLCNVAVEPVVLDGPVFYHQAGLEEAFVNGETLPLVTCLSTIEHIGYDNSQYGVAAPARWQVPTMDPLLKSLHRIIELTAPGGAFLVSVPYGFREALVHPATGKVASQVFDFDSMSAAIGSVSGVVEDLRFEVFRARPEGWLPVDPESCQARYADGCPAAGAVAFLSGSSPVRETL